MVVGMASHDMPARVGAHFSCSHENQRIIDSPWEMYMLGLGGHDIGASRDMFG